MSKTEYTIKAVCEVPQHELESWLHDQFVSWAIIKTEPVWEPIKIGDKVRPRATNQRHKTYTVLGFDEVTDNFWLRDEKHNCGVFSGPWVRRDTEKIDE